MKPRVLIICNALDDATRQQRSIVTDSPAASRKIIMLSQALRLAGVESFIISLGRGKANCSSKYFPSILRRIEGVPVLYLPFIHIPFLSEIISLLSPIGIIFRFRKHKYTAIVYYNRMTAYLPALFVASIFGYRNVLDLEDAEMPASGQKSARLLARLVPSLFDRFCGGGALLACNSLANYTVARPVISYYGTANTHHPEGKFESESVRFLMGGTLCHDTGAEFLIDAIRSIRDAMPPWSNQIIFEVTGKGPSLSALQNLAAQSGYPKVIVHGRTTDLQYCEILARCDVGLALKLNGGLLANTTFPSKVVEFASIGLLVLTTDISDVREVLGDDGAYYLPCNDARMLVNLIELIIKDRAASLECARRGMISVQTICAPFLSGMAVKKFIFNDVA